MRLLDQNSIENSRHGIIESIKFTHEKNLLQALRLQFDQCQQQPACYAAFGNVEQQMWDLLEKVEAENNFYFLLKMVYVWANI